MEDASNTQQETEVQEKPKTESPTPENRDPLKWFGILVPQNLKQAQCAFKEGELRFLYGVVKTLLFISFFPNIVKCFTFLYLNQIIM